MRSSTLRARALAAVVAVGLVVACTSPAVAVSAETLTRLGLEPARQAVAAPDFRLRTLEGGQMSLSEQRGRVVVLNFWTTW